jgi:putative RecB family exonuclease
MYEVPAYFSPSSLSTFMQCPQRFKFEKIDKLRSGDTEATVRGSFVHEILEELLKLDPEHRTIEVAKNLSRELWNSSWSGKAEPVAGGEMSKFMWTSWWCVENYFEMEDPKEVEPMGLEVEVQGLIEGVPLFGIVDRWIMEDGKIIVQDYKSGKVPKPQYSRDKKLQIMIYADLLEKQTGLEAGHMDLLYVKEGKVVSYEPTPELRASVANDVANAWDEMTASCESEKFETRTGPLCSYCDHKPYCPAFGGT